MNYDHSKEVADKDEYTDSSNIDVAEEGNYYDKNSDAIDTVNNAIDFTKCLGKRPATRSVAESPTASTPTLTFEQFSDFCRVDMLNQLRQQPSEQDNSSHEAVLRRGLCFGLEDQLPTLEAPNSLKEFLPIHKNNDCLVLEPDEELTAVLSRCTNQAEPSNKHFTADYLKDYEATDNIICLPSTNKAPSVENIIFQDIEIKVTEDNIQEEHISPDDILENKIQNCENPHRSTPKSTLNKLNREFLTSRRSDVQLLSLRPAVRKTRKGRPGSGNGKRQNSDSDIITLRAPDPVLAERNLAPHEYSHTCASAAYPAGSIPLQGSSSTRRPPPSVGPSAGSINVTQLPE
ncbi:hypothetical protein ILUMI_00135 [Ignelater luminosus]|uniref:Uncharacterized protein n=1 Tax=Ignelater luminosus TaxID=2038154 RepID=A0A8K0DT78_IGNLU|nr:hypothetical protein ILUMI_00135 [Ignelater luminosus]